MKEDNLKSPELAKKMLGPLKWKIAKERELAKRRHKGKSSTGPGLSLGSLKKDLMVSYTTTATETQTQGKGSQGGTTGSGNPGSNAGGNPTNPTPGSGPPPAPNNGTPGEDFVAGGTRNNPSRDTACSVMD